MMFGAVPSWKFKFIHDTMLAGARYVRFEGQPLQAVQKAVRGPSRLLLAQRSQRPSLG